MNITLCERRGTLPTHLLDQYGHNLPWRARGGHSCSGSETVEPPRAETEKSNVLTRGSVEQDQWQDNCTATGGRRTLMDKLRDTFEVLIAKGRAPTRAQGGRASVQASLCVREHSPKRDTEQRVTHACRCSSLRRLESWRVSKRCSTWARNAWEQAGGHIARVSAPGPDRWCGRVLPWKDRHALRRLHAGDDGASVRRNRGHRLMGKRRWDDPVQATVNSYADMPRQDHAQDREVWDKSRTALSRECCDATQMLTPVTDTT